MRIPSLPSRIVAFATLLAALPPAGVAQQAFTERASGRLDREAIAAERAALHADLLAERVDAGLARPLSAVPTRGALATVETDRGPRRMVGVMVDGGAEAAFHGRGLGAVGMTPDGWVWTAAVTSPEATAIRVAIADFALPVGAELFIYTETGQVAGPYTGRGPGGRGSFLSHTLFGSEATLQVRYRGSDEDALAQSRLTVSAIGHLTERFTLAEMRAAAAQEAFCNFNEPCVENASCSSIPPAISDAQDAVAHMLFQSGAFLYICSGGLLADSDPATDIPYFLTAHHCISKNNEASSLETFFQFTTGCGGPCSDPGTASTLGSSIKAKDKNTDFTLLELDEPAPAGSAFLGWNATPIAFTDGAELFRVSHPAGAPQAYSEHVVDTSAPTCGGWPRGRRIYSRDTFGATEGGSSGSPVLNDLGQVVGQLSGACGTNVNDPCDAVSNATVDGAFAEYFDRVADFLDGGGSCLPQGDPCTDDGQCCSNKCRGPSGNRSCR